MINDFILICKKIHNDKYDYSFVSDIRSKSVITILDKSSGLIYKQYCYHHKNGLKPTKIESNSLIEKLKQIHNRYEYVIEKEAYFITDKIKIIDKLTNSEFYYRIDKHLSGMKPNKVTLNYFLLKSKEIHNDRYNYSLINEIKGGQSKVDIICNIHGIFKQTVSNHINMKHGCPKCVGINKWNTELVVSEFKNIHKDLYDYSKVEFNGINKKVDIICNIHGIFKQNIHKHLNNQGCPKCSNKSKGEEIIKEYLDKNKIKYIRQHGFETCKYINKLSFDFYLPELNTCIEFDGIQHFKPISQFGGEKEFESIQKRDKCKDDWCIINKVNLIRIRYDQIVKDILESKLKIKN
jgi:very-short-patch-repair endonuclease